MYTKQLQWMPILDLSPSIVIITVLYILWTNHSVFELCTSERSFKKSEYIKKTFLLLIPRVKFSIMCKSSQLDNLSVLNTLWLIFLCIITWWFQSFVKMYIAKLGCLYLLCNWLKFSLLTLRSRVRIQQGLLFLLWISIHFKKLIFPQNLNLLFLISSWIHAWNPYL